MLFYRNFSTSDSYERFSPGKQKGSKDDSGRDDNNALMEAGKKATLA